MFLLNAHYTFYYALGGWYTGQQNTLQPVFMELTVWLIDINQKDSKIINIDEINWKLVLRVHNMATTKA